MERYPILRRLLPEEFCELTERPRSVQVRGPTYPMHHWRGHGDRRVDRPVARKPVGCGSFLNLT